MGIWDHRQRSCMSNVIRGFQNLQSLAYYAEPSAGKNPYRSVRAFPAYQANIQSYPDPPSASVELANDYWDRVIYDARTEFTDYQCLVDTLVHLRPTLQLLQLPGGFWTLPGAVRKPIPRFDQFTQLKTLVVPQAALISIKLDNMRFDVVFEGDFELSASMALPISLQHLKIFDVDAAFLDCEWLRGLFDAQKSHKQWPKFRTLEILMGPTFSDEALGELLARQSDEGFWAMADDAAFEVVVGRDIEGPDTPHEVNTP
ncbi:hypothetical protein TW65_05224 [Stemphylium lycopersici]|uniref:Uncharacterized protein n=1 Tax=Stemphylium lycopersici TaxID=183478 RepID=A0A364MUA7_STELY|nr:hypothetical protein TW65_05224 [Stemphylium lycopersici]RAR03875.1 hypothetical protein DDE83_008063 [Stemphylium lycopersici]